MACATGRERLRRRQSFRELVKHPAAALEELRVMLETCQVVARCDDRHRPIPHSILEPARPPLGVGQRQPERTRIVVILECAAPLGHQSIRGLLCRHAVGYEVAKASAHVGTRVVVIEPSTRITHVSIMPGSGWWRTPASMKPVTLG